MIKCTGKRCPMQVGYDVSKCQCEDCSYRTAPMTNYERIRNMSVEEMAEFISKTSTNLAVKLDCEYVINEKENIKRWLESEVTEDG